MDPKESLASTLTKSMRTLQTVDMIQAKKDELWAKLEPHIFDLPKGLKWDFIVSVSEDGKELQAEAKIVPDIFVTGMVQ